MKVGELMRALLVGGTSPLVTICDRRGNTEICEIKSFQRSEYEKFVDDNVSWINVFCGSEGIPEICIVLDD